MDDWADEIAAAAARRVVEEGMDYGSAKRHALRDLGLPARTALPGNDRVEAAVREHIAVFHADTQPQELAALRHLAVQWMRRLAAFRPHLSGAVWHGSATRHSDVVLHLYCDDPKAAEIALIDMGLRFRPLAGMAGADGSDVLALSVHCPQLDTEVGVCLWVHDRDAVRGALRPDAQGRPPCGDLAAVERLVDNPAP